MWRIIPDGYPQFSDETKVRAKEVALAEAIKQTIDMQDIPTGNIRSLGEKWGTNFLTGHKRLSSRYGNHIDDLLALAVRANRFSHYYQAELTKSITPDEFKKLVTAKRCKEHYPCGTLVAMHCHEIARNKDILEGTSFAVFPEISDILEALFLDSTMQAAMCLPEKIDEALGLLADAASSLHMANQCLLQMNNYLQAKEARSEKAKNAAEVRAEKFKSLEAETIRLYESGKWASVPLAAAEITPKIVAMSRNRNGDLLPSTTKPLEWIRAHNKKKKNSPS